MPEPSRAPGSRLPHFAAFLVIRYSRETIVLVATNRCLWLVTFAAVTVVLGTAAPASSAQEVAGVNAFAVRGLVSDGFLAGTTVDSNLVNAWGLAASGTGPWWVANENTETSTLYDGTGRKLARVVTVAGGPTGVVFNGTTGFVVTSGGASAPARFIYACEDGKIRGWAGSVPTTAPTRPRSLSTTLSGGPSIAGSPRLRRPTARRTSTRPTSTTGASTSSMPTGAL